MSIDDVCDACCFSYELIAGVFAFFANATGLFICCFLYHLYPLAIFALELFEFCDLGLVVALGCLKERQHWPFLGSVPIS